MAMSITFPSLRGSTTPCSKMKAAATFANVTEKMGPDFAFTGYQRGPAFVDLNNDGFMDSVVTSLGEKPRILMNNALVKNHWIMFELRGHKSNRDGIKSNT